MCEDTTGMIEWSVPACRGPNEELLSRNFLLTNTCMLYNNYFVQNPFAENAHEPKALKLCSEWSD